jgi:hypothetical protein
MQDAGTKGGGWFKVGHDAMDAIVDACEPKHRHYVIAGYVALLRVGNDRRAPGRGPASEPFEATRQEVATLAGMSVDTLDRVVVPALAALGLVTRKRGVRGGANRWTITPRVPPRAGRTRRRGAATSGRGRRSERVGVPLGAALRARGPFSLKKNRSREAGHAPDGAARPPTFG